MGILRTKTIEPATGSTLTLGASGDTITVSSDSIKANTFKDAGGNTLFTSDGAGTLSSINSALVPGGPILISTATASNASSVDITSGIDSTYDEYMFVFTDINPATDDVSFYFNGSDDASSWSYDIVKTTTYINAYHSEDDSSTSLNYSTGSDLAQGTGGQRMASGVSSDADHSAAGTLHLFNPSSTTYVKHFYSTNSHTGNYNGATGGYMAGYFNTTSAITAVTFLMSSGNFDGTIQMYGIK